MVYYILKATEVFVLAPKQTGKDGHWSMGRVEARCFNSRDGRSIRKNESEGKKLHFKVRATMAKQLERHTLIHGLTLIKRP